MPSRLQRLLPLKHLIDHPAYPPGMFPIGEERNCVTYREQCSHGLAATLSLKTGRPSIVADRHRDCGSLLAAWNRVVVDS